MSAKIAEIVEVRTATCWAFQALALVHCTIRCADDQDYDKIISSDHAAAYEQAHFRRTRIKQHGSLSCKSQTYERHSPGP